MTGILSRTVVERQQVFHIDLRATCRVPYAPPGGVKTQESRTMSTLANFEDDLFISYAHIDNQPLAEGLKGWSRPSTSA